jgi:serine/threonine protein kinase/class 3 adenylate cyclase
MDSAAQIEDGVAKRRFEMINSCKHFETESDCLLRQLAAGTSAEGVVKCALCDAPVADLDLPLDLKGQLKDIPLEMAVLNTAAFSNLANPIGVTSEQDSRVQYIGRFVLQHEIGRGGMGIVYQARDPNLDRPVAIKLLTNFRQAQDEWVDRFRREARMASALNHPNILTIHEIGESNGAPYIAAEFVEGTTLRQLLSKKVKYERALKLSIQLASGIAAAHAEGIIHRDLKPENVMVRADDLLKILDFGLARLDTLDAENSLANPISQSGFIAGTFGHMSPEQARGKLLDAKSDVFSLGIMLYMLFAGQHPFPGESPHDVMAAILDRAPKAISDCDGQLPSDIGRLLLQCLSKEAAYRPTAAEVFAELERIAGAYRQESTRRVDETETSLSNKLDTKTISADDEQTNVDADKASADSEQHTTDVRYARSKDGVNIAWQAVGSGPIDIVFVMGWVSHLEWFWKEPTFAHFLNRLASFARVILFDKRGTGMSDNVALNELPTLELRMDDVRAVMEAAGSRRAVLCGVSEGGPLCSLFAATYPQKTIALAMIGCYARRLWAEDYPWGPTSEQREVFLQEISDNWGGPLGLEDRAPSKANDEAFRRWWASYLRMGASPAAAVALTKMNAQIDVRPILPTIQVPTLVIHRTGDRCLKLAEGKHLAALIPGAKFVELAGDDHLPFVGDAESILSEIELFLTGRRQDSGTGCSLDRVLATVLQVFVEDDSALLHAGADEGSLTQRMSQLLTHVERQVELYRGQNLAVNAGQITLTFDGPARAVRAAAALTGAADRLGTKVRCGLDTGACDIGPSLVSGPAVEQAARIAGKADFYDVIVSQAVMHLVSGSGLQFVTSSANGGSLFRLVR